MPTQRVSIFSNRFQDHFVVDRQGEVDIAVVQSFQDRQDASWEWTGPNLSLGPGGAPAGGFGGAGQLRRAGAPLGFALMIATFDGNRIHSKFDQGIADPAIAAEVLANSTFILEKGLIDPNHVSFRSQRFPDLFTRQRDFHLVAEPVSSPEELQAATFRFVQPALNADEQ